MADQDKRALLRVADQCLPAGTEAEQLTPEMAERIIADAIADPGNKLTQTAADQFETPATRLGLAIHIKDSIEDNEIIAKHVAAGNITAEAAEAVTDWRDRSDLVSDLINAEMFLPAMVETKVITQEQADRAKAEGTIVALYKQHEDLMDKALQAEMTINHALQGQGGTLRLTRGDLDKMDAQGLIELADSIPKPEARWAGTAELGTQTAAEPGTQPTTESGSSGAANWQGTVGRGTRFKSD